jgi:glycine cleavage system aminomethyltransferase T
VTGSGFIGNDIGWIKMHLRPEDGPVEVRDVTEELACLGLWGPRAREVLQPIVEGDVSNQALPYMSAREIKLRGFPVLAQRVTYVGELGWELYMAAPHAVQVWDALIESGSSADIETGGYKVLDSLRLEKGYRYYSMDVTTVENPYAAGLGFAVRLDKGDFIGRQALIEIKERGLDHRLCTITVGDGEYQCIYGGEAVLSEGVVVGRLRSAGYGHTLKKNIAYTYLPMRLTEPDTKLQVEVFGQLVPAVVTADVLYDPEGARLKV